MADKPANIVAEEQKLQLEKDDGDKGIVVGSAGEQRSAIELPQMLSQIAKPMVVKPEERQMAEDRSKKAVKQFWQRDASRKRLSKAALLEEEAEISGKLTRARLWMKAHESLVAQYEAQLRHCQNELRQVEKYENGGLISRSAADVEEVDGEERGENQPSCSTQPISPKNAKKP